MSTKIWLKNLSGYVAVYAFLSHEATALLPNIGMQELSDDPPGLLAYTPVLPMQSVHTTVRIPKTRGSLLSADSSGGSLSA